MENPKMQSLCRCNKRTGRYGKANKPISCTACRAERGNLGKFEAVKSNGISFAPKQCLCQKVAVCMENTKMQSLSRCNKRIGRYGPAKNPVSCITYRAERGNLENFEAVESNGTAVAPKQCLYKRWLWEWRTQKCNHFVGAINALGVTARQINWLHAQRIGPREKIWEISKLSKAMVPPLHQSNVSIKR